MPDFDPDSIVAPPPPERLARVQENFGRRFPQAYLDFLNRSNGACLRNPGVNLSANGMVIDRFLPLLADPDSDPLGDYDISVVASRLDTRLVVDEDSYDLDLIPIALLFAGDYVVLDYRDEGDEPKVSRWYHEESEDFCPSAEIISDSFSDFLKHCN